MPLTPAFLKSLQGLGNSLKGLPDDALSRVAGRIMEQKPIDHVQMVYSEVYTVSDASMAVKRAIPIQGLMPQLSSMDAKKSEPQQARGRFLWGRILIVEGHNTHASIRAMPDFESIFGGSSYTIGQLKASTEGMRISLGATGRRIIMQDFPLPPVDWMLTIDTSGTVTFSNASLWIYLVLHNQPSITKWTNLNNPEIGTV